MKKLSAVFLILIFFLTFSLSACGQKNTGFQSVSFEDDWSDLGGTSIHVCGDLGEKSETFLSFAKTNGIADKIRTRFSEVASEYNCNFVQTLDVNSVEDIAKLSAIGLSYVDFFVDFIFYGGDKFKEGILTPMSEVSDYIDLSDSFRWGNPNNMEIFARNGEIYGVFPASWPETGIMSTDFLLIFNRQLLTEELNQEDPRQYYEQKKWTPERFVNYVRESTIQRGGEEKPIYGLTAADRHLTDMALKAYNVYPARRDENGVWAKGYKNANGVKALTLVARFLKNGDLSSFVSIQGVEGSVPLWAEGGATTILLHSNYTFSQAGTDSSNLVTTCGIEYGLMPFPSENGELIAQYERCINAVTIPTTAIEPGISGMLINELFAPLPGFETEEDLITYYANNIVFDEKDARLLVELTKVSRYLFHNEGMDKNHREIVSLMSRNSPQVTLDIRENAINQIVEDSVIPAYETIEELFGYRY